MTAIPPLVRTVQTCLACPSQWNAWDADGQYYYLRYRSGIGTVHACADSSVEAVGKGLLVAEFRHGGYYAGDMGLDEFLERAGMVLA